MKEHHILSLSGGKDSTALAFFIKENMPQIHKKIEYVFCDTEQEIPETYDYLNKIEVFLDKKITRIKPEKGFEQIYLTRKILPSVNRRWCTVELKTKPFQNYIKNNYSNKIINLYIGIRSDEASRAKNREKYANSLPIKEHFPFVDNNITKDDVENILKDSGIGLSDYYKWRKRSGCYFCMFQSKKDWLKLYKNHPDLYYKAMEYEFEQTDYGKKQRFGWNVDISLKELIKPCNMKIVEENYKKLQQRKKTKQTQIKLFDLITIDKGRLR